MWLSKTLFDYHVATRKDHSGYPQTMISHTGIGPKMHKSPGSQDMKNISTPEGMLGGGFKFLLSSPLLGEMIQFDSYFSNGLKPPTRMYFFRGISDSTFIFAFTTRRLSFNHLLGGCEACIASGLPFEVRFFERFFNSPAAWKVVSRGRYDIFWLVRM